MEWPKWSSGNVSGSLNATRITLIYIGVALVWIYGSDSLSLLMSESQGALGVLQNIKGTLFVLLTGALLYAMVRRYGRELEVQNMALGDAQNLAQLGSWRYSVSDETLQWSDQVFRIFDLPVQTYPPSFEQIKNFLQPESREKFLHNYERALETKEPFEMEAEINTASQNHKYVRMISRLVVNSGNEVVSVFGTIMDITSEKKKSLRIQQDLQEKEVLLKEVHHRVKNNLAVIGGLLDLQLESITDQKARQAFVDSKNRIYSMAKVHELLYRGEQWAKVDMKAYVNDICDDLYGDMMGNNMLTISQKVSDMTMSLNEAIPLGLIVNELLTHCFDVYMEDLNATDQALHINIELTKGEEEYDLRIEEQGGCSRRLWDGFEQNELRRDLIQALSKQLHGELEISYEASKGFYAHLKFGIIEQTRMSLSMN
jgi:two-component sensor histidine kinase